MATNEPMTDERLSEIRARVKNAWAIQAVGPANMGDLEPWQLQSIAVAYVDDVADLLDEVDSRRAREQALAAADEDADETLVQAVQEMKRLKDDNTRLRARAAAMRPMVALVARGCVDEATIGFPEFIVALDGDDSASEMANAESLIEQARAFVAAHPATATATATGEAESEGE